MLSLFFTRLKHKLNSVATFYPNSIDWVTLRQLYNWINVGLVFQSGFSSCFTEDNTHLPSSFIVVKCKSCQHRYFVKNVSVRFFKKYYNKNTAFDNCWEHHGFEIVSSFKKMPKEYIKAVNNLYLEGFSKDFGVIMKYVDNHKKLLGLM